MASKRTSIVGTYFMTMAVLAFAGCGSDSPSDIDSEIDPDDYVVYRIEGSVESCGGEIASIKIVEALPEMLDAPIGNATVSFTSPYGEVSTTTDEHGVFRLEPMKYSRRKQENSFLVGKMGYCGVQHTGEEFDGLSGQINTRRYRLKIPEKPSSDVE